MTVRFQDHYTFEAFVLLRELRRRFPLDDTLSNRGMSNPVYQNWLQRHNALKNRVFGGAVESFLLAKVEADELPPILNGQGRETYFTHMWNTLKNLKQMDNKFINLLYNFSDSHLVSDVDTEPNLYEQFCGAVNAGNLESHLTAGVAGVCNFTGMMCHVDIRNWQPIYLGCTDHPKYEMYDLPIIPPYQVLREVEVEFKTGNLLVSDWFDVGSFTQVLINDTYHPNSSIYGRNKRMAHVTTNYSVVTLSTGSFRKAGYTRRSSGLPTELLLGDEMEDSSEFDKLYEYHGSSTADTWNLTIVEREQLIALARNEAFWDSDTEDWLANRFEGFEVKVEPGVYVVQYCANYTDFRKEVLKAGIDCGGMLAPTMRLVKKQ